MPYSDEGLKSRVRAYVEQGDLGNCTQETMNRMLRRVRADYPDFWDEIKHAYRQSNDTTVRFINNRHSGYIRKRHTVGVIGDTHCPFDHPRYAEFCHDTFREHGVTQVVHIGDLVDNHAISRHQTETVADSAMYEYRLAIERLKKYFELFPELILLEGNHDTIPIRQLATLGIPQVYLKDLHELWELPATWKTAYEMIIDDVYYFHGIGSSGKTPAYNRALGNRMSTVQGHTHTGFGVKYHANPSNIVFGADTGCGIDADQYAFEYGRAFVNKPILGCLVVYSSCHAVSVPMGYKYFRS